MSLQDRSLSKIVVWLAPIVLSATLAAIYIVGTRMLDVNHRLDLYQRDIDLVNRLVSDLKDAETGQRGFLLLGDARYLEPYNSGAARVRVDLQEISDRDQQGEFSNADIASLTKLSNAKLGELSETIRLRRSSGLAAALPMVATGYGSAIMDSIRRKAAEIVAAQQNAAGDLQRRADTLEDDRTVAFLVAILINLAVLFWAFRLLRAESARRQATAIELQRQNELLEVTFASIADGVIVTDIEGRIVYLNSAAETLTGWTTAEAMHRPSTEIFHIINENSRALVASPIEKVLSSGAIAGLANHTLLIRKDGRELPIDDSGAPIRASEGPVRGVVMIFRDASREREALRRIEEANRALREANEAKDLFLATLSHELRTPLTPVLALLTEWESSSALTTSMRADAAMMRRNVELEAHIIDDLLDLTRIARGKLVLNREPRDLHTLLSSIVAMHRISTPDKQFSLNLDASDHYVEGDEVRLHQVFNNVITNAVKFTPADGRIEIASADDSSGNLVVTITDNGIGMSADTLNRLFEPFEQGGAANVGRAGLGLGLAIAKRLIEMHGGSITAFSEGPDRGSIFTIDLPSVAKPNIVDSAHLPDSRAELDGHALAGQGASILLVEDHEDTAEVLGRLLENHGYRVATSGSIAEALRLAQESAFDLLLSDIGLPDGSGVDLLRAIRKHCSIPAIALTGFGTDKDTAEYREAGFDRHLAKPVNFQLLHETIAELLAQSTETAA